MSNEALHGRFEGGMRVAVIGAGPAGFYAASALLKQSELNVWVDMYERLPAPFGLVRYGVAPDHAKIKSVTKVYEKTASHERFRLLANVQYGTDIFLADLQEHYDQVIFTVGAQGDRELGVPGEKLAGSSSAREFVAWYNGHPDYRDFQVDLSHKSVVVVGVGNVALDVARILAKTADELRCTDIADHALVALAQSKVEDIYVLARRGPAQVKFTLHEIREFGEFQNATTIVRPSDLELDPASRAVVEQDKAVRRNVEVLQSFSPAPANGGGRRVHFLFKTSPQELMGESRVEKMRVVDNLLEEQEGGYIQSVATDSSHVIDCGLVLRSVGYRGTPIPELPFDAKRSVVANVNGRVVHTACGEPVAGLYVAGWIKRGPTGVIGTNKPDALETVKLMLSDAEKTVPCAKRDPQAVLELLKTRGVDVVDLERWRRIDEREIHAGKAVDRPRVKLATVQELLSES